MNSINIRSNEYFKLRKHILSHNFTDADKRECYILFEHFAGKKAVKVKSIGYRIPCTKFNLVHPYTLSDPIRLKRTWVICTDYGYCANLRQCKSKLVALTDFFLYIEQYPKFFKFENELIKLNDVLEKQQEKAENITEIIDLT